MSRQADARLARGANRSRPNEEINLSYGKAVQMRFHARLYLVAGRGKWVGLTTSAVALLFSLFFCQGALAQGPPKSVPQLQPLLTKDLQEPVAEPPNLVEQIEVTKSLGDSVEPLHPAEVLLFPPTRNGIRLPPQVIEYDVSQPGRILFGPVEINKNSMDLVVARHFSNHLDIEFGLSVGARKVSLYIMGFKWPLDLFPKPRLRIIDEVSRQLWSRPVTEVEIKKWTEFIRRDLIEGSRSKLQNLRKPSPPGGGDEGLNGDLNTRPMAKTYYGLTNQSFFDAPLWEIRGAFRLCVHSASDEGQFALCSQPLTMERLHNLRVIRPVAQVHEQKVWINDAPVTLKGSAIFVDIGKPIRFQALTSDGVYLEFLSRPKQINLVDVVAAKNGEQLLVTGYGSEPRQSVQRSSLHSRRIWDFLDIIPTIGDLRLFWRTPVSVIQPSLYFAGKGGVPFRQDFEFDIAKIPKEESRLVLVRPRATTYRRFPEIRGTMTKPSVLSTTSTSVVQDENDFKWKLFVPTKGRNNLTYLELQQEEKKYVLSYEIYRGYPREIGARMTGVVSNDLELIFLGEMAGQWWFESVLGWENEYVARNRWGIAVKHFQAFAAVGGKNKNRDLIDFNVTSLDLKFRLTPGIWNRDATLGLILNSQKIVLEQYEAAMYGTGFFWARSMPRFIDSAFNLLPIMRYPKWVDLELLWYRFPLNARTKITGLNFSLNFHGKILWTDQFYGEAGFGLKSYQFGDVQAERKLGLGMAYATAGLGFNF